MKCPECKQPMAEQSFEGVAGNRVAVDVCHGCRGLWFDRHESRQLAPGGTLRLFREMHGRPSERRQRGTPFLSCPRCDSKLETTYDMAHNNRFQYSRCTRGHGHFITFFHFLREKGIARSLKPRELAELRKHVDTLTCSDCGEPVRIANLTACLRCQAPLSLLDPDCVRTTVRDAQEMAGSRRDVPPEMAAQLLMTHMKRDGFNPKPEHRSNAIPNVDLLLASSQQRQYVEGELKNMDLIGDGIVLVLGILGELLF
jgi:hypothetical protein